MVEVGKLKQEDIDVLKAARYSLRVKPSYSVKLKIDKILEG
jgi:hypothetical protein